MPRNGIAEGFRRRLLTFSARSAAYAMGDDVAISVLLVVRDGVSYLDLLLASLVRQRLPRALWEVVVAYDASQDGVSAVLDRYRPTVGTSLKYHRCQSRSNTETMFNRALDLATGRVAVLMEAHSLATPDFLTQHLLHHRLGGGTAHVVLGSSHQRVHTHCFTPEESRQGGIPVEPMLAGADLDDPGFLRQVTYPGREGCDSIFRYYQRIGKAVPYPWAFFTTANVSLPTGVLSQIGGFDARFAGAGIANLDMGYRLYRAGISFCYAPEAVSLRQLRPRTYGSGRETSRDVSRFFAKYPRLSSTERQLVLRTVPDE